MHLMSLDNASDESREEENQGGGHQRGKRPHPDSDPDDPDNQPARRRPKRKGADLGRGFWAQVHQVHVRKAMEETPGEPGKFTKRGKKELPGPTRIAVEGQIIQTVAEHAKPDQYPKGEGEVATARAIAVALAQGAEAIRDVAGVKVKASKAVLEESETPEMWADLTAAEIDRLVDEHKAVEPTESIPDGARCLVYNQERKYDEKGKLVKRRLRATFNGSNVTDDENASAKLASQQAKATILNMSVSSERMGQKSMKLVTWDLKDFYLNPSHKLKKAEYAYVRVDTLPPGYIEGKGWGRFVEKGRLMLKVVGALYGLPLAGKIARQHVLEVLEKEGFRETGIPGLGTNGKKEGSKLFWASHVDDFICCAQDDKEVKRMISVLENAGYTVKVDEAAKQYCGMTFTHTSDSVIMTAPQVVEKSLSRFGLEKVREQDTPGVPPSRQYGQKVQLEKPADDTPRLSKEQTKLLQEKIGVLLYLAITLRLDILVPVTRAASLQSNPTEAVMEMVDHIFGYLKKEPNLGIEYKASDMVLRAESDASYNSEAKSRSRTGGYLYYGRADDEDWVNGPVMVLSAIQRLVATSACEAEYVALFETGKAVAAMQNILEEMGLTQPGPTVINCDNQAATAIANDEAREKRTRHMSMRLHWVRDKVYQHVLAVRWRPGCTNLADFVTKLLERKDFEEKRDKVMVRPPTTN